MKKEESVIQLTQELVRIDSTNPGGYEGRMGEYVKSLLRDTGAKITSAEVLPGRFNIKAELSGDAAGPELIYICHMDTVVTGEGWTADPFGGAIKDGNVYGRGACDMKGGLACAVSAFQYMADKKKELRRPFVLILTADEEDEMRGAEKAIADGWVKKDSWVLDMEPTDGQIQVAHKGRFWLELETAGHTAHASMPEKGADAIFAMAHMIVSLRSQVEQCRVQENMGPTTVTFGQIQGGYRPYVVPDRCRTWVDMRLAPPVDRDMAIHMVETAIETGEAAVPGVRGRYKITGDRPYIEMDENSGLLKALQEVCRENAGIPTGVSAFPGYTDTAVIAGKTGGRNCMSYGPGSLKLAHKPDEYVPCGDLLRCEKVLKALAEKLLC